jgi:hypothetical protein
VADGSRHGFRKGEQLPLRQDTPQNRYRYLFQSLSGKSLSDIENKRPLWPKRRNDMQRIGGKRQNKHLTLSEYSIGILDEFAHRHGLNFSQTIEQLALIGLQDTKSIGLAELVAATVKSEMARQYNRFAKLSAMAALEAGAAKELVQSVYWYLLLNEYAHYEASLGQDALPNLADFEATFKVPTNSAPGKIVGTMMKKRSDQARFKSVKSLRSGLAILQEILEAMEGNEA